MYIFSMPGTICYLWTLKQYIICDLKKLEARRRRNNGLKND